MRADATEVRATMLAEPVGSSSAAAAPHRVTPPRGSRQGSSKDQVLATLGKLFSDVIGHSPEIGFWWVA
jgi:hypothetical protein